MHIVFQVVCKAHQEHDLHAIKGPSIPVFCLCRKYYGHLCGMGWWQNDSLNPIIVWTSPMWSEKGFHTHAGRELTKYQNSLGTVTFTQMALVQKLVKEYKQDHAVSKYAVINWNSLKLGAGLETLSFGSGKTQPRLNCKTVPRHFKRYNSKLSTIINQ